STGGRSDPASGDPDGCDRHARSGRSEGSDLNYSDRIYCRRRSGRTWLGREPKPTKRQHNRREWIHLCLRGKATRTAARARSKRRHDRRVGGSELSGCRIPAERRDRGRAHHRATSSYCKCGQRERFQWSSPRVAETGRSRQENHSGRLSECFASRKGSRLWVAAGNVKLCFARGFITSTSRGPRPTRPQHRGGELVRTRTPPAPFTGHFDYTGAR